jgi:competence protein ComEC
MTLPFVLHIFGQMSRASLLANVLVVSFIPLAMLLGAIAGLSGMLAANLTGWVTWPAIVLLNYMLDVAHLLAGLPDVFIENIELTFAQMLMLYFAVAIFTAALWFKNSSKSAIITDMTQTKSKGLLA